VNKLIRNSCTLILIITALHAQEYTDYKSLDAHADKAPASVQGNIDDLARYLIKPASNDFEKIRALFRWVTQNINYDMEKFSNQILQRRSEVETLKEKLGVCDEYSNLLAALGKAAGLEMAVIYGYSKGYGYTIGDRITSGPNHAWNAVKINWKWYLIDATWGAGYIDEQKGFMKKFQEYYFLTPPEKFIYDHFPDDERWQLVDHSLSMREFQNLPNLQAPFFEYGLILKSHQQNIIRGGDYLQIDFFTPDRVSLITQLEQDGRKLPEYLTFSQRKAGQFNIFVQIPDPGSYILKIYAKDISEPGEYRFAMEYKIEADHGKTAPGFPVSFASFSDANGYLFEPISRRLSTGSALNFRISVPDAFEVVIKNNDQWHILSKKGQQFDGQFTLEKGKVTLYAKFREGNQFNGLLEWICE